MTFGAVEAVEELESEDTTPEFEGPVFPSLIPPFCDIFTEDAVYLWFRLVDGGDDLDFEECGRDSLGRRPDWTDDDYFNITDITGMYRHNGSKVDWALHEGLAPGQPFVVQIDRTQGSTDYWGEHDSWNDWAVVHRLPRRPEQAARAWIRVRQNIREYIAAEKDAAEKLRRLRIEDVSAFILKAQEKRHASAGYKELNPPGLSLTLCSRHWRIPEPGESLGPIGHAHAIAWGSDDTGSHELAFMNLIKDIEERLPQLDVQAVRQIKQVHRGY